MDLFLSRRLRPFWLASNLLLIGILVISCEFKRLDTQRIQQEMKSQQIRQVTAAQVSAIAAQWGEKIAAELGKRPLHGITSLPQADSLAKTYGARIRFVSNLADPSFDVKTREVFDAYRYNATHRLPQENNLQKLGDGSEWLYTIPVTADKPLLDAGKAAGLPASLQEKDLAGVWTVYFNRKELIRLVSPKELDALPR